LGEQNFEKRSLKAGKNLREEKKKRGRKRKYKEKLTL
jgi:hypothetical protein